ncbi:P-type ATPase, transmembrane domain [Phytophthora cactorum]|nr:P-type ATPase, transmembrane domain [Phytophthora cactorum]
MPTGMTALQILSIDLGTELGPAVSIAHEGGEHDIMQRPPRNVKKDRFISKSLGLLVYRRRMINAGGCLLAYGAVFWRHDVFVLGPDPVAHNGLHRTWVAASPLHSDKRQDS